VLLILTLVEEIELLVELKLVDVELTEVLLLVED
jgi:hypothetical protein